MFFLFTGVVSASNAELLQPAGATTFLESLRVGVAGSGGVTFFNGTVLNEGSDPFTVGDDMRVDGEIYRAQKGGDPIKISDNVIPTVTNTNNFGDSSHRWKKVYVKDGDFSGIVTIQGGTVWTSKNDGAGSGLNADMLDGKQASAFALSSHNHDSRYYTETESNNRFLKLSGGKLTGDISQPRDGSGLIKASVFIDEDTDCGTGSTYTEVNAARYYNYLNPDNLNEKVYCNNSSGGIFSIRFCGNTVEDLTNCNLYQRHIQATIDAGSSTDRSIVMVNSPDGDSNKTGVYTYNSNTNNLTDYDFFLTVY